MGKGLDGFVYPDEIWRFEIENEELFPEERATKVYDAAEHKMKSILLGCRGEKLVLEYDYGDGWEVEVTLESITEDKDLPGRELPRVLEGAGYGIVEDCGGTGGLEQLAEAFRRKAGDDYETYREWLGLEDMNMRLKRAPRIYAELYEYGYAPSQRSIDFLERKYLKQQIE